MKKITLLTILCFALIGTFLHSPALAADDDPGAETVYVMIEPYLITNFTKKNGRLGYLNTVPRIVTTKDDEEAVNTHMPMIKDYLVELLGSMPADKITDTKQRAQIQKEATEGLQKLFKEEVGKKVVKGVLFKKFLTM